jgi:hypothetical protein
LDLDISVIIWLHAFYQKGYEVLAIEYDPDCVLCHKRQ